MIDIRSLRDLVRLFYIFRREFWLAFAGVAVLAVAGAFLLPPKYMSDARLLVKPGRENMTAPIEAADRQAIYPQSTTRDPILDEEKMLTGRPVLMQVARLYLAEMSAEPKREGFVGQLKDAFGSVRQAVGGAVGKAFAAIGLAEVQSEEEAIAEKLAARFAVTHGPGSNVMELSFTWGDPVVAQRVLKSWIRVYLDERTTVLGRKTLVTFYEAKVRDSDQQIESAKSLLRTRLVSIDGTSAQERLDALTKRLNDLSTRRAEIAAERTALLNGIGYANQQVGSLAKETVSERELGNSPTFQALSTQLADLKRQRADALRIFKDTAPTIVALNESIATLEVQLKTEDRVLQRSERRTPNELNTVMARNQLEKSMRLRELDALHTAFDKEATQLETVRRKVLETEPELARLEQALSVAEKSRALYLDSLEKARIDQALDDNRINNIAQIQEASLNPSRSSPKSLLLLILALPAGGIVGLAVVYLCAMFDQRIHDGGRFEERFGVPLWSAVKDIDGSGPDNDFHASLYRIYGTLPLERIQREGLVLGLSSARSGEGVSFLIERLQTLLQAQGLAVRVNAQPAVAAPGEVVLLEASGLHSNRDAFVRLSQAHLIVLVVEARASTVPVVENALGVLRTAFRKVDGVILNRRRFEVPPHVLRWLQR
ncbi:exopolysaccharide transport family protein [Aquabacterium sp.]|uniref:GumC family protein n=1 Tax=Aquabacterium sp. TaxID=1872578 RepID=UPI0024897AFA|nr:exopolysaccharide transport family protein [Aquabacterium sp.]MDI1349100.1 exopolysaccharide transport family protein [Aquabacterium sp.]